jgi:lipopolysaccharide transport system permease protein
MQTPLLQEIRDLWSSLRNHELWMYLAWNDIIGRYRRTIIGPLWLVIANAISIGGMGVIWSIIFKISLISYFPKLAASMICWTLLSGSIQEASNTFVGYASIIQNLPLSLYVYPLRVVARNFMTYAHNLLILVGVFLLCRYPINSTIWLFIPILTVIGVNLFCLNCIMGIVGARYKDFPQIISAIMSIIIFITPVMWDISMLGKYQILANINPLTHLLMVLKSPLLGVLPPVVNVIGFTLITVVNIVGMLILTCRYRYRIPYWI